MFSYLNQEPLIALFLILSAGLLLGNMEFIGRIPSAARIFMTEIGLILFLGHAGIRAGGSFP